MKKILRSLEGQTHMKFILMVGAVISALVGVVIISQLQKVEAGYVGVKVNLLGSDKGVDIEELSPGRYWIGINEDLFRFPTFANNYVWTKNPNEGSPNDESITFQSVEGMNVNADVGITYSIDPDMATALFQRYRRGITEITDTYLYNMVRDALVTESGVLPIRELYGTGKADLMSAVETSVSEQIAVYGINIERIYWIGGLRLPPNIVASIDSEVAATAKARQRDNEIAETIAEAKKVREAAIGEADAAETRARGQAESIRIIAEAQANANRQLSASLSDQVIAYQAMQKWDGILPTVTGGATPFIQLPVN